MWKLATGLALIAVAIAASNSSTEIEAYTDYAIDAELYKGVWTRTGVKKTLTGWGWVADTGADGKTPYRGAQGHEDTLEKAQARANAQILAWLGPKA
jgi:hypothetical protein